jgi:dGTPase
MKNNPLYVGTEQFDRPSGNVGARADELGRDAFRKDYARLLHAPAFRRLQGKTQLFPGAEDDFFRNRLSHSLEVAQIAHGIASRLNAMPKPKTLRQAQVNTHLVEFAALAHDLGHPPFGHNGEAALDELMHDSGGFEGNAQTLRILAAVERKLIVRPNRPPSADYGLDLTYRSLAAVLKYDRIIPKTRKKGSDLAKGYYGTEADLVATIRRKVAPGLPADRPLKTIECDIMDIADDIAYSTYDLEDSLHAGFVSPMSLAHALVSDASVRDAVVQKTNKALREDEYEAVDGRELLEVIADVFDITLPFALDGLLEDAFKAGQRGGKQRPEPHFVDDVITTKVESWLHDQKFTSDPLGRTQLTAERVGRLISSVDIVPDEDFPQLSKVRLTRQAKLQVEVLKHLNYELVIRSPRLAIVEHRGRDLVSKIFTTVCESDGALLPSDWRSRYVAASKNIERRRLVCDFVAGMTDRYAAEFHARLLGNGATIFKPF